jgi:hypothetical protein
VVIFSKDDVKCRDVALRYGFKNVWTATDVNANFPSIWPFRHDHPKDFKKLTPDQKIDAALVFNDPAYDPLSALSDCSDWGRDIQIIIDLALSPDGTFAGTPRLAKQNRSGTGTAIVLSAYALLQFVLTLATT